MLALLTAIILTLNSIFGNLSFGKKRADAEAAPSTPTKEATVPEGTEPVAESAPVIPAVETTEPLSTEEVSSPAAAPAEATEAAPATNGDKKEVKAEKRKSSLPFTFGKKEKAAASDEEGEKPKSPAPFFSKLRQTVKGKSKATEKPAEDKPAEAAEPAAEDKTEEAPKEEAKAEEAAPAAEAKPEEESAEKPVPAAPAAVPAAA